MCDCHLKYDLQHETVPTAEQLERRRWSHLDDIHVNDGHLPSLCVLATSSQILILTISAIHGVYLAWEREVGSKFIGCVDVDRASF